MRHAAGKRYELALVEDRQGKSEMIEMTAGRVGIIGDIDIAGLHVFDAEMTDFGFNGLGHPADESRQAYADRDRFARGCEQARSEVERLVDDHIVGRAHEVRLHFLCHGEHAITNDLHGYRVDFALAGSSTFCSLAHRLAPATRIVRLP